MSRFPCWLAFLCALPLMAEAQPPAVLGAEPVQPDAAQAARLDRALSDYILYRLPLAELHAHLLSDDTVDLRLELPGTAVMELRLSPRDLRAPGYRAERSGARGRWTVEPPPSTTWAGTVAGGSFARFSTHAGFEGLVRLPEADLVLEGLHRYDPDAPLDRVVAYRSGDVRPTEGAACSAPSDAPDRPRDGDVGQLPANRLDAPSLIECHDIELATDAAYGYWSRFGEATFLEQLAELNVVEGIYADQLGVTLSVTYQHAFTDSASNPYRPWITTTGSNTSAVPFRLIDAIGDFSGMVSAGLPVINTTTGSRGEAVALPAPPYNELLLDQDLFPSGGHTYVVHLTPEVLPQFVDHWSTHFTGVMRDVALLYNDLGGGGQAYRATVCQLPGSAYGQRGISSTLVGNILLSAHELAHTIGARHAESTSPGTDCSGSGPIMCSAVQPASTLSFLPATVADVRAHLSAWSSCTSTDYPYAAIQALYSIPAGYSSLKATYAVTFDPISYSSIDPGAIYRVEAGHVIKLQEDFLAPAGAFLQLRIVEGLEGCTSIIDREAPPSPGPSAEGRHPALSLAPNPATAVLRCRVRLPANAAAELTVHDAAGRPVWRTAWPAGPAREADARTDVRAWPTGSYRARLSWTGGQRTETLIVVRP